MQIRLLALHLHRVALHPVLQLQRSYPCAPNKLFFATAFLKVPCTSSGICANVSKDSPHGANSARVYFLFNTPEGGHRLMDSRLVV